MPEKENVPTRSEKSGGRLRRSRKWRFGDLVEDRYEVYDVRAGGIGIVYIVYDHGNGIPYALKTLQDRHVSNSAAVDNFIREAEVWVRLGRHQNIVHAVCVDKIDGWPYIFLECVLGSSLKEVLSGSPLAQRTVLKYAIQFCRGMIHAQERIPDFAHLDIKPENCLLTQDGTLKVTDFSLSKAFLGNRAAVGVPLQTEISLSPKIEKVAGTFPYMSPEQFAGVGGAGRHSDVYSFGVMLYEMLTGKRPFLARSVQEWRDFHMKSTPQQPRVMIPSISRKLNDLTFRSLAKNPADRPDNFSVILKCLESVLWEEFHEEIPIATSEQLESWEYSNMGVSLCHLGRVQQAISCFDNALSRNPEDPHAWLNKGVALGTLGNATEEFECYERALAIKPDYTEAWYNKGLALYKGGRFEEAVSCYDHALTINPLQAGVWVNKGSALGGLGRFQEEASCYEKALGIEPKHVRAWIGGAAALVNLGFFEKATAYCDRALAIAPDTAEAWVNKASALGALKRFDEAILCCEKALAINPRVCEAWVCKGLALVRTGRLEEAVSCYEKALGIDPKHADAWYNKGLALKKIGLSSEGDRCLRKAVAIDPGLSLPEE